MRQTTAGIAAFVTEPGAAMTYLSDVQWKLSERSFLLVVQANGEFFFVCPGAHPTPRSRAAPRTVHTAHTDRLREPCGMRHAAFEEGTAREQTGPDAEMILWEENESPFAKVSARDAELYKSAAVGPYLTCARSGERGRSGVGPAEPCRAGRHCCGRLGDALLHPRRPPCHRPDLCGTRICTTGHRKPVLS